MAEQEQKRKNPSTSDRTSAEAEADVVEQTPATSERGEKIKAELDDLLDEIDEVGAHMTFDRAHKSCSPVSQMMSFACALLQATTSEPANGESSF